MEFNMTELGHKLRELRRFSAIFHVSTDYLLNLKQETVLDVSDLTPKQLTAIQAVIDSYRN